MRQASPVSVVLGVALAIISASVAVRGDQAPATSAAGATPKAGAAGVVVARTSWGDPDLQGYWTNAPYKPTQKQPDRKTRAQPTGGGPDHWYDSQGGGLTQMWQLPLVGPPGTTLPARTPAGEARETATLAMRESWRPDGPEDMSTWDRCITRGVPAMMLANIYNNNYQILQIPGYVVILYEMIHDARIIPLGGPHVPASIKLWNGSSRARWEGDVLVVETKNLTDRTQVTYFEGFHSDRLHVTERFIPVNRDMLEYRFTIDDPETWTQPWTAAVPLKRGTAKENRPLEYACHEGNYGISNMLSAARALDRKDAGQASAGR